MRSSGQSDVASVHGAMEDRDPLEVESVTSATEEKIPGVQEG